MQEELQRLLDDPRFREYHRKTAKRKEFNAFEVLRYSDYEIRHSNVLAWLLQPGASHGLGSEFLKWFVEHHNAKAGGDDAISIPSSFPAKDVRIERELDFVDVTVFLKGQKHLLAIENKTVGADSEHFEQVRAYEKKLREKFGQSYQIRSVLLTTSPEDAVSQQGFVHMSWSSIIGKIRSLESGGAFPTPEISAFIRQYLDAVSGWLASSKKAEDHYVALRKDYGALWKEMLDVLGREGGDGVARLVLADGTEFRPTVVRLAKEFGSEPKDLRNAVGDFLKRHRKFKTETGQDPKKTWFAQYWELSDLARDLGIGSSLRWGMDFSHKKISIGFYLYQEQKAAAGCGSDQGALAVDTDKQPGTDLVPHEGGREVLLRLSPEVPVGRRPGGDVHVGGEGARPEETERVPRLERLGVQAHRELLQVPGLPAGRSGARRGSMTGRQQGGEA